MELPHRINIYSKFYIRHLLPVLSVRSLFAYTIYRRRSAQIIRCISIVIHCCFTSSTTYHGRFRYSVALDLLQCMSKRSIFHFRQRYQLFDPPLPRCFVGKNEPLIFAPVNVFLLNCFSSFYQCTLWALRRVLFRLIKDDDTVAVIVIGNTEYTRSTAPSKSAIPPSLLLEMSSLISIISASVSFRRC